MHDICYGILCLTPVSPEPHNRIFGFAEFLVAVALLVVVFTITDIRYKFRIAIVPGNLYADTFAVIVLVGFQTLLTDVWLAESWWVPSSVVLTPNILQGIFGALFFTTFVIWIYYAYMRPPIFGPRNAKRFADELFHYVLRGNDDELRVIANELIRSAGTLVNHCKTITEMQRALAAGATPSKHPDAGECAYKILFLIANRRLCKQIVASSPGTAQAILEEMANRGKMDIPIGPFVQNISAEAISQPESFIYTEAGGVQSGLIGYLKPVSTALYGNYELIRALGEHGSSPLDVDYRERSHWNADQWAAYCQGTLLALKDSLKQGWGSRQTLPPLNRAFGNISGSFHDVYKLDGMEDYYDTDTYQRLRTAVEFAQDAIRVLNEMEDPPAAFSKVHRGTYPKNVYDNLATLAFDLCFAASQISKPIDVVWMIHYNTVWDEFFGLDERGASGIVQRKVSRLLYDEIVRLSTFPNFKGSRILGFCLSVLGVKRGPRRDPAFPREAHALAIAVQAWTRREFLRLREANPDVADSVLIGNLTFDKRRRRLVQTGTKGLRRRAPTFYLQLVKPRKRAARKK